MSIQTEGRYGLISIHLMDANTREEDPLCKAAVEVPDLISVQDHLERRMNDLPVPTVCGPCKVAAVPWAENRCRELEAEARDARTRAGDVARYGSGAEAAELEADRLEERAREYRQFVERLAREVTLDDQRG